MNKRLKNLCEGILCLERRQYNKSSCCFFERQRAEDKKKVK